MRAELQSEIDRLRSRGITPGLAAVLVGDNLASDTYVRMKGKACDEAGLYHETIRLKPETTEAELLELIERLNADHKIHGILVQLPLPKHIDAQRVLHRVSPGKDVDGFHPENVGKVSLGDPSGFRPATPYGVQQLLVRSEIETKGQHAVIVGRSNIVGRPMAALLLQDGPGGNATVTVCHSRTRDIKAFRRRASGPKSRPVRGRFARGRVDRHPGHTTGPRGGGGRAHAPMGAWGDLRVQGVAKRALVLRAARPQRSDPVRHVPEGQSSSARATPGWHAGVPVRAAHHLGGQG